MVFEREIILCILKLSKDAETFSIEDIATCSGFASSLVGRVVNKLIEEGKIISTGDKMLVVNDEERLRLACLAVNLGCDVEKVSRLLTWKEFEVFCSNVLESFGFKCFLNFRFKHSSGRGEIDILGLRKPFILCLDAKHWGVRSGKASGLRNAVKKHIKRVEFFGSVLDKYLLNLGIEDWGECVLVPLLVTLFQERIMFDLGVPVAPVFKLNSFLMDFDGYLDELCVYKFSLPRQRKII
jgi:hypothetical protein